jgi:uncharacterized membrane protein (DUF485 family)
MAKNSEVGGKLRKRRFVLLFAWSCVMVLVFGVGLAILEAVFLGMPVAFATFGLILGLLFFCFGGWLGYRRLRLRL